MQIHVAIVFSAIYAHIFANIQECLFGTGQLATSSAIWGTGDHSHDKGIKRARDVRAVKFDRIASSSNILDILYVVKSHRIIV